MTLPLRGDPLERALTIPRGRDSGNSHTCEMGFNPHRQHKQTTADYVMVVAAFVICAALLAWAFLG